MERPIDSRDAHTRHPDACADVAADLARKAARAQRPAIAPHDIAWSYAWCYGPEGYHVSLQGQVGKSRSAAPISTIARLSDTPPEIQQAYDRPKASVERTPHVATMEADGATYLVLGAYQGARHRAQGTVRLVCLKAGENADHEGFLYTLDGDKVWFAGGFRPQAARAYAQAGEGGTWRYRNVPFERLTPAAITAVLPPKARYAGVDAA